MTVVVVVVVVVVSSELVSVKHGLHVRLPPIRINNDMPG